MNANELLFKSSRVGDLMGETGLTEKQAITLATLQAKDKLTPNQANDLAALIKKRDNPQLPTGAITYLNQLHREITWKRRKDFSNKYIKKGIGSENNGIAFYSLVKGYEFAKNEIRLNNAFLTGEIDIFRGKSITKAKETIDIKLSWDAFTFPYPGEIPEKKYIYQGHSYMDLSGAEKHTIAHCLINTPAKLITDEKKRLAWDMGIIEEETEDYIEGCKKIERNCIFDMKLFKRENPWYDFHSNPDEWEFDIPAEERVFEYVVERDDSEIRKIYERIKECRDWLNENLFLTERVELAGKMLEPFK